ncbi:MAG TPA: tetratricopeptide repeat protein [Deltaproteobacteria bacterium]|nr:tetratricopeptide repeat protein [Deltaproteobacteria bacterium]
MSSRQIRYTLAALLVFMLLGTHGLAGTKVGEAVPGFTLKDLQGTVYDLSALKDRPMVILYFFDAASRPSQEFMLTMDSLTRKYQQADLMVWAITRSPKDAVAKFTKEAGSSFPILLDDKGISDLYDARLILPTTCIVGPGLTLLDSFQGGGKTTNVMLVRLAERTLQRNETHLAKAITGEVIKKDPADTSARMIAGYASLKGGDVDEAQKTFTALSNETGPAEVLGKEGLASVHAVKGEPDKALQLAAEVEQKAPDRGYVNVVKGDILYSRNDKAQAEAEYTKAVQKQAAEDFQKATANNKLGRLYASVGQYDTSRGLYDQAVKLDPYYVEAMTNKGLTYEKQGDWGKALDLYRQGQSVSRDDVFALALAKRATEMMAIQGDAQRKERMDRLIKDLAERYRTQKKLAAKDEDIWTSRPMVLSFVDFQESGTLSERDGFSTVITSQLADQLNASGRVKVVERVLIERLLEELNLGSSDLADPETALRLGRVLAAKIMGTGSLIHVPGATMMSLRLIDTETSAIPKVFTSELAQATSLKKELADLNRDILATIMQKYPLQAYIVNVSDTQVMINLGTNQGVVLGTTFEVIEEQGVIEYKGRKLQAAPKTVAKLEVTSVEPDLAYCRIVEQARQVKRDDKVVEKIDPALIKG